MLSWYHPSFTGVTTEPSVLLPARLLSYQSKKNWVLFFERSGGRVVSNGARYQNWDPGGENTVTDPLILTGTLRFELHSSARGLRVSMLLVIQTRRHKIDLPFAIRFFLYGNSNILSLLNASSL